MHDNSMTLAEKYATFIPAPEDFSLIKYENTITFWNYI